jgi:uncharacterized membrane protein
LVLRPVKVQPVEVRVSEDEQAGGVVTAGDDVTVKPVSVEPPFAGIAHEMATEVVDEVADATTDVGAPGLPVLIELDEDDAVPNPKPLEAVTVKV